MARRPKTPRWLDAAREAGQARAEGKPDWLGRALARAGVLPLAEAEDAIRGGRVQLNGRVAQSPFAAVNADDVVRLDGHSVSLAAKTIVLAFHKPAGVVTARVDPEGHGTVFERFAAALPAELQRFGWHAVGRLDRDTTGLLLFTNDERFVAHATSPATHLSKRYVAHVLGVLDEAKLEPLRRGLVLHDGPTRPAKASVRAPGVVELTLTEGRNHQVKRMLGELGLPVTKLHREAVGAVACDVAVGAVRQLSEVEVREGLGFRGREA